MPDTSLGHAEIVKHRSFNTLINGTEYLLESREISMKDQTSRLEYRVLLGKLIVKDWTIGDIHQYFDIGRT